MHDRIARILDEEPSIELAILFGSYSKGTQTPQSDVDIAVMLGSPLSSEKKKKLITKLGESLGCPVDLIDLRKAGEPLLGQILSGEILIDRTGKRAVLLAKHLLNSADFQPLQSRILRERRERWINE